MILVLVKQICFLDLQRMNIVLNQSQQLGLNLQQRLLLLKISILRHKFGIQLVKKNIGLSQMHITEEQLELSPFMTLQSNNRLKTLKSGFMN